MAIIHHKGFARDQDRDDIYLTKTDMIFRLKSSRYGNFTNTFDEVYVKNKTNHFSYNKMKLISYKQKYYCNYVIYSFDLQINSQLYLQEN